MKRAVRVRTPRATEPELGPRDALELLCLARGLPAEARPRAAMSRVRLEGAGLIRGLTRLAWDGREVPAGYAVTPEGLARVAAMRADAAAERGETAGGSMPDVPGKVACGGGAATRRTPGQDCEQGSNP